MVAGHLQEKNGIYYMVLSYPSANGKRKNKWISTKLPVKGNKKKAEKMLSEIRQTFVPVEKPMDAEINFSDYMLQWLQIIKPTVATTTYASYSSIVQKIVVPYFERKAIPLAELKAIDIQAFFLKQRWIARKPPHSSAVFTTVPKSRSSLKLQKGVSLKSPSFSERFMVCAEARPSA